MLVPKKVKYRKPYKVSFEGPAKGNKNVCFGKYGLRSCDGSWVTNNQIEAARIVINRFLGRTGKLWIRVFPHMAKTKKPLEVRMGSGKGNPEVWVSIVKRDTIIFELDKINEKLAREAFRKAGHKLPIKTVFVKREI